MWGLSGELRFPPELLGGRLQGGGVCLAFSWAPPYVLPATHVAEPCQHRFICFRPTVLLRAFSWFCTWGSLLTGLRDLVGCRGIRSWWATCMASESLFLPFQPCVMVLSDREQEGPSGRNRKGLSRTYSRPPVHCRHPAPIQRGAVRQQLHPGPPGRAGPRCQPLPGTYREASGGAAPGAGLPGCPGCGELGWGSGGPRVGLN